MNTRFNFRAWDKMRKEMVYDFSLNPQKENCVVHMRRELPADFNPQDEYGDYTLTDWTDWYAIENLTVMQWTGQRDKNNKEIYESDIVLVPANYGGDIWYKEWVDIVTWEEDGFVLPDAMPDFKWKELEVVGNIFEGVSLMKDIPAKFQKVIEGKFKEMLL